MRLKSQIEKIDDTHQIVGDFTDENQKIKIMDYFDGKIDAVISDMAVNTTGNKSIDSIVTGELSVEALNFSTDILKNQGCFVSKIFMGPSFNEIMTIAKKKFEQVNLVNLTGAFLTAKAAAARQNRRRPARLTWGMDRLLIAVTSVQVRVCFLTRCSVGTYVLQPLWVVLTCVCASGRFWCIAFWTWRNCRKTRASAMCITCGGTRRRTWPCSLPAA